jgi:hypothetical protein
MPANQLMLLLNRSTSRKGVNAVWMAAFEWTIAEDECKVRKVRTQIDITKANNGREGMMAK